MKDALAHWALSRQIKKKDAVTYGLSVEGNEYKGCKSGQTSVLHQNTLRLKDVIFLSYMFRLI
jgi:hypothetical protein